MKNELTVVLPQEVEQLAANVSVEKRTEVQNVLNYVFNGVSKMREQLDTVNVSDENDKVNMKIANTIRLGVRSVRLESEKVFDAKRSEVQQAMLSFKTEDALWLKAKQTMQILTKEIETAAKWKEETKERFDTERKELKIQERINKVAVFNPDISRMEFESMGDETFSIFLSSLETRHNKMIEAEQKAEAERLEKEKAEAEERARIRIENERLKAEAEVQRKQAEAEAAERAKIEKERIEKETAERKEREEKERKERQAHETALRKEREERERIEKEERAKREKLEAELKAKAEAEAKAKADAEASGQAELNKGDAEKVQDLINSLSDLKTFYVFKSAKSKKMYSDVGMLIDKVINHIQKQ